MLHSIIIMEDDTSMSTYFVRHTEQLAVPNSTIFPLWRNHWIAIHYPEQRDQGLGGADNTSLDPNDYSGTGRASMKTLSRLGAEGGYVWAEYRNHPSCLVGKVVAGTPIELHRDKWRETDRPGREAVLKRLALVDAREIGPADCIALRAARPQQGTICQWSNIGERLRYIVDRQTLPIALESLTPAQQEVMCSEFLRHPCTGQFSLPSLETLLMPVGRTMKDVDIYGLTVGGQEIFAQVTYHPLEHAAPKRAVLDQYATKDRYTILFCRASAIWQDGLVLVFPIEEVFNVFKNSPEGVRWLERALQA
jgi:hypothetical protein